MLKFIFSLLVAALVSLPAQAQWFPVNANVRFTNAMAEVTVYNSWGRTIYCEGQVVGYTYHGNQFRQWMGTYIYPGNWGYAYVYTNNVYSNPFVNAWVNVNCTWY